MRLLLDGKLPTAEELKQDELVAQMLQEAQEEGKKAVQVPTKESILQAVVVDDLKENAVVKQMIADAEKAAAEKVDKKAIIQGLTKEDLKDHPVIGEMLQEGIRQVKFSADVIKAFKDGNIQTASDDAKKSLLKQMSDEYAAVRI